MDYSYKAKRKQVVKIETSNESEEEEKEHVDPGEMPQMPEMEVINLEHVLDELEKNGGI